MKVEDAYTKDEKAFASAMDITCELARKLLEIKRKYKNGDYR